MTIFYKFLSAFVIVKAFTPIRVRSRNLLYTQALKMSSFATVADVDLCTEAASRFINDEKFNFYATTGGVNNVVQFVETSKGDKYVLRIYNNGLNSERVEFEHGVLQQLRKIPTSFKVPTFLPDISSGSTHIKLSNGAEACMCELIPGTLPKLSSAACIGRAAGELVKAMESMTTEKPSPNPTYFDIYKAHHATTRETFFEYVEKNSDVFVDCREAMDYLVQTLIACESKLVEFKAKGLPEQLIHADLHYLNVLVEDDRVSACLDFEFCVRDWRVMELAVALSKYAGEAEGLKYFDELIKGFQETIKLTKDEVEAIADGVNIRIISNVIYFVGRAIAGEDSIASLTTRAKMYADRIAWVNRNRQAIVSMCD